MTLPDPSKTSSDKWSTLRKRAFSSLILIALLAAVVLWADMWAFRMLVCLFCILTAWEWSRMFHLSGKPGQPWLSFSFGAVYPVILSFVCAGAEGSAMTVSMAFAPLAVIALAIVSFCWEMRRVIVGTRSLRAVGNTVLSFLFPVWMFSFAIPVMEMAPPKGIWTGLPYGVMVVLWVVLFTKATDIFAYLSGMLTGGRIFKDRKLIPHISPKKTWEGLIGSYFLSIAFGWWLGGALGVIPAMSLAYGVLMTVLFLLAVVGDLAGSLIKRSLSIKDSGSLLPGIGGIFDLIDSPAFTVPFVLYLDYCRTLLGYEPFFM